MSKPKILVVDDDEDYLESTAAVLKANGYEVLIADNGKDGFEKAKAQLPQLIIIDLLMNDVNEGYDLCLKIGHDRRFEGVPLLMISAARQNAMLKNANFAPDVFWFPIDAFLDKPINKETLLKHVNDLLKKQ